MDIKAGGRNTQRDKIVTQSIRLDGQNKSRINTLSIIYEFFMSNFDSIGIGKCLKEYENVFLGHL